LNAGFFDSLRDANLQWLPELGIGWYPVTAQPYNGDYWENYRRLDKSPSGDALTAMRIALVEKYWSGVVVDVGIGGGRFVSERPLTWGFDVNPAAVAWLKGRDLFRDPYEHLVDAVTFWDSLEHIHDPRPLLANVRKFVFVSLPIFEDVAHVLRSKHFKKEEHCWYFSARGFESFMLSLGFQTVERNTMEQSCREDISSYVFRRVRQA